MVLIEPLELRQVGNSSDWILEVSTTLEHFCSCKQVDDIAMHLVWHPNDSQVPTGTTIPLKMKVTSEVAGPCALGLFFNSKIPRRGTSTHNIGYFLRRIFEQCVYIYIYTAILYNTSI